MLRNRNRNKDGTYAKEDYSKYLGKKFGKLTIIDIYSQNKLKGNTKRCKCICECGNTKHLYLSSLIRGTTKSCGCIVKNDEYDNLVGQRFGKLLVIEELPKSALSQARYRCICDCGNYIDVYGANLLYNQTKSCGCIHKVSAYNDTIPSNNKSGVKGVYYNEKNKKWVAKLGFKGTTFRKSFNLFNDAVEYRKLLEEKYHRQFKDEYKKFKQ